METNVLTRENYNLSIPFIHDFKWGVGAQVTIQAKYGKCMKGFQLALTAQPGTIYPLSPFYLNYLEPEKQIVMNYVQNSIWGKEKRSNRQFNPDELVVITITCTKDKFLATCSGEQGELKNHAQNDIVSVFVDGSLEIKDVVLKYDPNQAAKGAAKK